MQPASQVRKVPEAQEVSRGIPRRRPERVSGEAGVRYQHTEPKSRKIGGLYHTMKNGIPGAWIGPGNPQLLHQANERIRVDDLTEAAKIYALLILRYCG